MVSGDEGGTVVMWDLATGRREGGFTLRLAPSAPAPAAAGAGAAARPRRPSKPTAGASAPPPPASHKLTAMAFDAAQRRLLTASDGGALALWNFNSGVGGLGCAMGWV